MNINDIDLTKKENQTFNNWFKIMWKNDYILLFSATIAATIFAATQGLNNGGDYFLISIPILAGFVIAYKGFYQFWKDLTNGISR